MPLTLRDFESDDLASLLDLWAESWSEVYAGIDFNARRPWFTAHIAGWQRDGGLCRVAVDAQTGALAGFIMIRPGDGLLDQICVAADRKGGGAARVLLDEARRYAPEGVDLAVNQLNRRAIRFYEREGFLRTGEGVNPNSGLPIFHYRWTPGQTAGS